MWGNQNLYGKWEMKCLHLTLQSGLKLLYAPQNDVNMQAWVDGLCSRQNENIYSVYHQYAGFITHSATSGQGGKGQFPHLGSTSINISHCIYHMYPLSVGTLPPSKAHISPEPRIHSNHYCVGALRIIARTKAHALSAHTQSDTQWYPGLYKIIQLCSILDREMSTLSHHALQKWASPSLSLVAL